MRMASTRRFPRVLCLAAVLLSVPLGPGCADDVPAGGRIVAPEQAEPGPPPPPPAPPPETQASPPPELPAAPTGALVPNVPEDPAPPGAVAAADPSSSVRDPRAHRPRAAALLITEIQALQSLFEATPASSSDRVTLLRRLAEDYVDLGLVAPGQAERAHAKAIQLYTQITKEYPSYPQSDEVTYFLGYELERARDTSNARRVYFQLISAFPSSRFVPYAYFAFAEMFYAEGDADPSKLTLAEQAFRKVLEYPKQDLAPDARLRLGRIYERLGDKAKASNEYHRLRREYPDSPAAARAPSM